MKTSFNKELHRQMKDYGKEQATVKGLQQTLYAVKMASKQRIGRPQTNYRQFLLGQMSFISAKVWIFQAVILTLVGIPLCFRLGDGYGEIGYRQLSLALGIAAIAAAMTGIPYICRSLRYAMYEVEAATRFSYSGLLTARLITIGAVNIIMLLGLFAALTSSYMTAHLSSAVYMLLPFTAVWSGCMGIMRRFRDQYTHVYCLGFSLSIMALLFFLYKAAPRIFSQDVTFIWGIVCIVMIISMVIEVRKLIKKTSFMDAVSFNGV